MTHARRDQAVGERRVAIHRDLRPRRGSTLRPVETAEDFPNAVARPRVTRIERQHRIAHEVLAFPAETLLHELRQLRDIEPEDPRDQTEHEDVLPLLLRVAADRLHRRRRDRHANRGETFVVRIRRHVILVVDQHPAGPQRLDVVLVTVLVERHEEVRRVAGREDVSRSHPHLENRGSAGDRRRNRHVSHDVLIATPREPGEKSADRLDPVLRISGETDHHVIERPGSANAGRPVTRHFGSRRTDHRG